MQLCLTPTHAQGLLRRTVDTQSKTRHSSGSAIPLQCASCMKLQGLVILVFCNAERDLCACKDDLDIQLDEPISGPPPSLAQRSHPSGPTRQSSTGTAAPVPGSRPLPGAPSQGQLAGPSVSVRPGVAPPRPPPGAPPAVVAPPPMPSQWPRPQFVHTATGATYYQAWQSFAASDIPSCKTLSEASKALP